jgi:hypothetical protein
MGEIGGLASLREFTVKPVFNQLCDTGAVDGDPRPLEPLRVVYTGSIRVCEMPGEWVVNGIP